MTTLFMRNDDTKNGPVIYGAVLISSLLELSDALINARLAFFEEFRGYGFESQIVIELTLKELAVDRFPFQGGNKPDQGSN